MKQLIKTLPVVSASGITSAAEVDAAEVDAKKR